MAQLRYMYTMPVERIVKYFKDNGLNCPSRLRITCSRKRQYFLTIFTIPCAWLSYQTNIWDVTRPTPKSSLKEPGENGLHVKMRYVWVAVAHNLGLVYFFYEDGSRKEEIIFDFFEGL